MLTADLPNLPFHAPGELFPGGAVDSHGVGDLGSGMVTWLYSIIGDYLLEFWAVLVPFFLALFIFWLVLPYLGLKVDQLDAAVQEKRSAVNGVPVTYRRYSR